MLVAPTRGGPFAVAMTAQIERYCMFDGQPACNHCLDEMIPAPALISHAVNENVSFLLGISPLPIVKFQAIMNEIVFSRLQIHQLVFATFHCQFLYSNSRISADASIACVLRACRSQTLCRESTLELSLDLDKNLRA